MFRECLIMACHYHPERESTDKCAICGKPICKECGLEIAGKVYCKDCLQKIVGVGLDETTESQPVEEPISETEYLQPEDIYSPQDKNQSYKNIKRLMRIHHIISKTILVQELSNHLTFMKKNLKLPQLKTKQSNLSK